MLYDVTKRDGSTAGHDRAVARQALLGRNVEQLCAFLNQCDPPGRARAAEDRKGCPNRIAAAGHHHAPLGIGVDCVDPHLRSVRLELIGQDAGKRRSDILPHLGADDVHGNDAVAIHAVPDRWLEAVRRPGRCLAQRFCRRETECNDNQDEVGALRAAPVPGSNLRQRITASFIKAISASRIAVALFLASSDSLASVVIPAPLLLSIYCNMKSRRWSQTNAQAAPTNRAVGFCLHHFLIPNVDSSEAGPNAIIFVLHHPPVRGG